MRFLRPRRAPLWAVCLSAGLPLSSLAADEPPADSHWGLGLAASVSQRPYRDADNKTRALPLLMYCLLYTSPSPRDGLLSRMPSSA